MFTVCKCRLMEFIRSNTNSSLFNADRLVRKLELSLDARKVVRRSCKINMVSIQEKSSSEFKGFYDIFDELISSTLDGPKFADWPTHRERMRRVILHTTTGGAKARGLMLVSAYKTIANPGDITEESMRMAYVLGWCVELFQSSLIILDDIADNSPTRRGVVCWHRLPGIGLMAINDSLLMLTVLFDILKENFENQPWYAKLLDIFNEATRNICIGQYSILPRDYCHFTMENFLNYSHYKRTHYTFKMPIYIALLLAKKYSDDVFQNIEELLKDMGILIAYQNDYADCYVDESISGKVGNDIEEGQCSWLAVKALELCNEEQRKEFETCYGSSDAAHVNRIKDLYQSLSIPQLCRVGIKNLYEDITSRIHELPQDNPIPPALILEFLNVIYNMETE